jgi:hypothetical protein
MKHVKLFEAFSNGSPIEDFTMKTLSIFRGFAPFKADHGRVTPKTIGLELEFEDNGVSLGDIEGSESDYSLYMEFKMAGKAIKEVKVISDIAEGWDDHDEIKGLETPEAAAEALKKIISRIP